MPLYRPNASVKSDFPKVGIGNSRIGIAVADDVEGIERVETESNGLLFVGLEILERGHIDVHVARPAHSPVARGAKGVGSRYAEGAWYSRCPRLSGWVASSGLKFVQVLGA